MTATEQVVLALVLALVLRCWCCGAGAVVLVLWCCGAGAGAGAGVIHPSIFPLNYPSFSTTQPIKPVSSISFYFPFGYCDCCIVRFFLLSLVLMMMVMVVTVDVSFTTTRRRGGHRHWALERGRAPVGGQKEGGQVGTSRY
jgi:hypothetical protein